MRKLVIYGLMGLGAAGLAGYKKICATNACKKRESMVDESIDESFPASDPPAWNAGSKTGAPGK